MRVHDWSSLLLNPIYDTISNMRPSTIRSEISFYDHWWIGGAGYWLLELSATSINQQSNHKSRQIWIKKSNWKFSLNQLATNLFLRLNLSAPILFVSPVRSHFFPSRAALVHHPRDSRFPSVSFGVQETKYNLFFWAQRQRLSSNRSSLAELIRHAESQA